MKKIILSLLAFGSVAAISSCKKNDSSPSTSRVMFVNGLTNSGSVDFSVGSSKVSSATNLAFTKNSGYQNVTAGQQTISYVLTSDQNNAVNGSQNFTAGSSYSVFAGGIVGLTSAPKLIVTTDDLSAPTSGNAKIRLVNLTSTADSLNENIYVGSNSSPLVSGISASNYSSFSQVTAGTMNIIVEDPNHIGLAQTLSNQQLSSGKIYTIILTGTTSGSGTSGFTLTVIDNN